MKQCSVKTCERKHVAKGYCSKHWQRLHKHGTIDIPNPQDSHGMHSTPEYRTWCLMKSRCCNINDKRYESYGGRGIIIYSEWLHDFKKFYDYIGKRPTSQHSIDRIENNGNYEPGNVRWATKHEQQANTRRNRKHLGIEFTPYNTWQATLKVNKIRVFCKTYKTLEEAIVGRKEAEIKFLGTQITK